MIRSMVIIAMLAAMAMLLPNYAEADLRKTAQQAKAKNAEKRRQEQAAWEILNKEDKYVIQVFLMKFPQSPHRDEAKAYIAEIDLWENARSKNTIEAYQNYLNTTQLYWYSNDASENITYLQKARDKAAWDKVTDLGTIEAYEKFLADNPESPYVEDAQTALAQLKRDAAWAAAVESGNLADYEKFVSEFPDAEQTEEAEKKIHELKGQVYYSVGKLNEAYNEFSKVGRDNLTPDNYAAFDESMEYSEFSGLNIYCSEDSLNWFIKEHPNSKYIPQVKNYLAIVKARNLSDYASEYKYDEARALATDEKTRQTVEGYITANRNAQKERERQRRRWRREENGGLLNIGLKFIDFRWNGKGSGENMICYDLGLYLRIGNYADRVQFSVGLEPGLVAYNEDYIYSYTEDMTVAFHMPVSAHLKLNLFKMGDPARFFVFGKYQYNAVRAENAEAKQAWSAGFGFSWKHFDWSFYYRQDMGKPEKSGGYTSDSRPHFFGTTMTAYWKL